MIHALPGRGADRRMFPAPWTDLPEFTAHDWTEARGVHTLPELAASVATKGQIQVGDTLIGSSLGGMVACEMAKLHKIPLRFFLSEARFGRKKSMLGWLRFIR
ncbi:MAG: hypothetical protein ACOZE5_02885 [Verrucomicrobiota bacterium]